MSRYDDIPATRTPPELLHEQTNGDLPAYVIPPDWWQQRPLLRDVYDWARARLIPPEILLAHTFAEIALRTPTAVVLPGIIGSPVAVNFGGVIVAEPGVGKSAGGRGLLADATKEAPTGESWPLGTGEGLTESLVDVDENTGERLPHGRPVLVHADEGRALEELIARTGNTLVSTLCTAISGNELGQGNATKKLRRRLPRLTYRVAVLLNLQPVYLKGVLADIDGGLPQRFLFVSGTGHHLDGTAGEPTRPLSLPTISAQMFKAKAGYRPAVAVPESIQRVIRADHLARLHAQDAGEAVVANAHRNLLRLRIAALLMFGDGRGVMTDQADPPGDWQQALAPVIASDATIARGEAMRAADARARAQAETDRAARHAVAADRAVEVDLVDRLAYRIARRVRDEPGLTRQEMRRTLSTEGRALLDDALGRAIEQRWIVEHREPSHTDTDRRAFHPGEALP